MQNLIDEPTKKNGILFFVLRKLCIFAIETDLKSNRPMNYSVNRILTVYLIINIWMLVACTKDGDVIYQPDPADQASTTPLVTVIYDPNAVGDGNYNDLIYQSVEQAAKEHDLRTMHLSPSSRTEERNCDARTGKSSPARAARWSTKPYIGAPTVPLTPSPRT